MKDFQGEVRMREICETNYINKMEEYVKESWF